MPRLEAGASRRGQEVIQQNHWSRTRPNNVSNVTRRRRTKTTCIQPTSRELSMQSRELALAGGELSRSWHTGTEHEPTSTSAVHRRNGRAESAYGGRRVEHARSCQSSACLFDLTDDAGDAFLAIFTNGRVTKDGVGPHSDLLAEFPYVGPPRRVR